jgi:hypothetical protein
MANGDDKRVASARNKASGLPTPPPLPRANSHEIPRDKVRGWLPAAAEKSDPQGTPYVAIGPGTAAFRSTVKAK